MRLHRIERLMRLSSEENEPRKEAMVLGLYLMSTNESDRQVNAPHPHRHLS